MPHTWERQAEDGLWHRARLRWQLVGCDPGGGRASRCSTGAVECLERFGHGVCQRPGGHQINPISADGGSVLSAAAHRLPLPVSDSHMETARAEPAKSTAISATKFQMDVHHQEHGSAEPPHFVMVDGGGHRGCERCIGRRRCAVGGRWSCAVCGRCRQVLWCRGVDCAGRTWGFPSSCAWLHSTGLNGHQEGVSGTTPGTHWAHMACPACGGESMQCAPDMTVTASAGTPAFFSSFCICGAKGCHPWRHPQATAIE